METKKLGKGKETVSGSGKCRCKGEGPRKAKGPVQKEEGEGEANGGSLQTPEGKKDASKALPRKGNQGIKGVH